LDSSFSYALSRRDQAVTFAYAQYSEFTRFNCSALVGLLPGAGLCAPQDEILQASQGIRHALERSTTLTVSAGGTFANERTHRDQPYHTAGFPNADLSLTHSFGERGSIVLELDAQLAPWVDFHTGLVSNRVQGQASLSDAVNKVVTLRVTATGLQTVPTTDTYALEMVSGSASMELRVDRQVLLAFGERGVWETQDALGTFLSTVTYLDVTVRAPTLPF
jgi:hypothetical protein